MAGLEFVLTHRLAGNKSHQRAHELVETQLKRLAADADVHSDTHARRTTARRRRMVRLVAPLRWIAEHQKDLHSDLILEERVFFAPHTALCHLAGGGHICPRELPARDHEIKVTVASGDQPLPDADVTLQYSDRDRQRQMLPRVTTDKNGQCTLHYGADCTPLAVGAYPAYGYWSAYASNPGSEVTLQCNPLVRDGPLGWWHHAMQVKAFRPDAGAGVRIGIIGTGVAAHPNLAHVVRLDDKSDLSSHGTHVCGLIAARPKQPGDYAGFAPGADVFTLRVFEPDSRGQMSLPDQTVLAHAIDELAGEGPDKNTQVDLINMSLGGKSQSDAVHDAIRRAYERGTVCLCSAGNTADSVEFPAAFPETVGVSGIGKEGWAPENSITALMTPPDSQTNYYSAEGLFLAMFSCFGAPAITCAGPGAGIISTVPPLPKNPGPYGVMDGTSLSCPAVCGLLASLMADSGSIRTMELNKDRSAAIVQLLVEHCSELGLAVQFEGAGLPEYSTDLSPIRSSS